MRFPFGLGLHDRDVRRLRILRPKPAKRVGKLFTAPFAAMSPVGHDQLVVVAGVLQGRRQILVAQRPVAMQIVEIVLAILKVDLDRLRLVLRLADEARIGPASTNVGEAADVA